MQEPIAISETPPLPGLQMVQQANAAIATVATDFAGDTDPAALAAPFMTWANPSTGVLFRRNAAGTAWVEIGRVLERPLYQADVASGLIPTGGYKNWLINNNFSVNQRAVSGTVVLAPLAYGHDRWKAGVSGCTYTFSTTAGVTTINITAGSLRQFVEGASVRSGNVTLSWQGTSQGSIAGGSLAASPVNGTATGGTHLLVEFGIGTLRLPQLEVGLVATPPEIKPIGDESNLCRRYYRVSTQTYTGLMPSSNSSTRQLNIDLGIEMRAAPTVALIGPSATPSSLVSTVNGFRTVWTAGDTTTIVSISGFTADAEI